jgi:aminoglycoside phosphotransferase (APT) family kinase protein
MCPSEPMAVVMGDVTRAATEGFVERYKDELGKEDAATLRRAAEAMAEWQLARLSPCSIIHGDYRLDNLLLCVFGLNRVCNSHDSESVQP